MISNKSAVLAILASSAAAYTPALTSEASVCKIVYETYTGEGFWAPDATTWAAWSTSSKPADPTSKSTTSETWAVWSSTSSNPVRPTSSSSWSEWTSSTTSKTTFTTVSTTKGGEGSTTTTTYSVPITTTTTESTTTTTTATTTTTQSPEPTPPTCPADGDKSVSAGICSFGLHCNARGAPDQNSKFWEKAAGILVDTLAECLEQCADNNLCEATLWVDDSSASASDYHRCYQISGLSTVLSSGYGQISFKGACSGTGSKSYNV